MTQNSILRRLHALRFTFLGIVLLFSGCAVVNGQTGKKEFELVDRFCSCPEFRWNGNGYELNDIKKSSHRTEIRFITSVPNGYESITVLTKDGGKAKGTYYHRLYNGSMFLDSVKKYGKWEEHPYRKFEIKNVDLDATLNKLIKHRLLSLSDQRDVYKKPFLGSMVIEFKANGKVGKYRFGPPATVVPEAELAPISDYTTISDILEKVTHPYRQISINTAYHTQY